MKSNARIGRRGPYRPTRFAGTPAPRRPGITPALGVRADGDVAFQQDAHRASDETIDHDKALNASGCGECRRGISEPQTKTAGEALTVKFLQTGKDYSAALDLMSSDQRSANFNQALKIRGVIRAQTEH